MTTGTALASLGYRVLNAARRADVRLDDLPLPAALRRKAPLPGERISIEALLALWRAAGERSRDPAFGLYVAEHATDASAFGAVGLLARHSATVGEALEHATRYASLVRDETLLRLDAWGGAPTLVRLAPSAIPPAWVEASLASYALLLRRWAEGPDVAPRRVDFRHAAAADPSHYERFFGCEVRFSQPLDRLVLHPGALATKLTTFDPELRSFFEAQLEASLGALPVGDDARERVRQHLLEALPHGAPDLARVARALAMSPRTLQRRLAEQGTSYHDVLDAARHELAMRALAAPRRPLHEAIEAAGFRDEKAFRRAVRRWTGGTPRSCLPR